MENNEQLKYGILELVPKEVLNLIFTWLSVKELAKLAIISKRFKDLSEENSLWHALFEQTFGNSDAHIFEDPALKDYQWKQKYVYAILGRRWSRDKKSPSLILEDDQRTIRHSVCRYGSNETIQMIQGYDKGTHYFELFLASASDSLVMGFAPSLFDIDAGLCVGAVGSSYGLTGLGGLWFRGSYSLLNQSRFWSNDTASFLLSMDSSEILVFKNFEYMTNIKIEGHPTTLPLHLTISLFCQTDCIVLQPNAVVPLKIGDWMKVHRPSSNTGVNKEH